MSENKERTRGAINSIDSTHLPSLPTQWCWARLHDLAALGPHSITDGPFGSNLKTSHYTETGPRVIRLQNIGDGAFQDEYAHISEAHFESLRRHEVISGDVAIAALGETLPRSCVIPDWVGPAIVKADCPRFRPNLQVALPEFVNYALNSPDTRRRTSRIVHGVGRPRLNLAEVRGIWLPVAPLSEQRRIVAKIEELFSDLDAGVAALNRAKANLKRYRASVLKAAVEGKLTEEWRARHPATEPASSLLARILKERRQKWEADQLAKFAGANKEPPKNWREKYVEPTHETGLFELPKSWTWASALEICEQVENGNTPPAHEMFEQVGDVPFIKVYNLTKNGSLDFSINPTFVSRKTHNTLLRRSRILPNDVLMNIVGPPLGKVSVVTDEYPEWNTNQAVVQFRARSGVLPRFLAACLMCDDVLLWIIRTARATAGQYNISVGNSRLLPLPLPPAKEQAAIVEILDESLSQIAAAETIIEHGLFRASRLRQSILKQAFEGKLVPQDPTDEPASVLLERLRASKSVHEGSGKPTAYVRTRGRRAKSKQASPPGEEAER